VILHTDVPTRAQLDRLLAAREPWSVSIYLPTDPASRGEAERLALKNLAGEASRQLGQAGAPKAAIAAIDEELADLVDDGEFWRHQARSLAVFVTPTTSTTFRLANNLSPLVEVADRFLVKPLLRAVTFPHSAFVLALAQNGVRLLELSPDLAPAAVELPDLPSAGAGAQARQFARRVDEALRPLLSGLDLPLILAAAEPTASAFRSVNSYPHLLEAGVPGNPEAVSDGELAESARRLLDDAYAAELAAVRETYALRAAQQRASSDVADVARAATHGRVDTVLVDIDQSLPGSVDEESGAVQFDEADDAVNYGVVDEIARRVWLNGGRVLAVRRGDIPGEAPVAAIFRYAP
jgi:hypothetical protein